MIKIDDTVVSIWYLLVPFPGMFLYFEEIDFIESSYIDFLNKKNVIFVRDNASPYHFTSTFPKSDGSPEVTFEKSEEHLVAVNRLKIAKG